MKITHHIRNLEYYELEGNVSADDAELAKWLSDNPDFTILACDLPPSDGDDARFSIMTTTREVVND